LKRSQSSQQLKKSLTKFNRQKEEVEVISNERQEYWPNEQKRQQTGKHVDTLNTWNTREIIGKFPKERY